jgi:hypothetical protein
MDAYNRGYASGIVKDKTKLDEGLGLTGQIGDAHITRAIDASENPEAVTASFFAISYRWGDETIISYRGTDNPLTDWYTGWLGGGGFRTAQADLAQDFFKLTVQGSLNTATNYELLKAANVSFTGHSLGGGLAGYIAGLYGKNATVFDNMPFELSATAAQNASATQLLGIVLNPELRTKLYGGAEPDAPSFAGISAYAKQGEILAALRLGQQTQVVTLQHGGSPLVGPVEAIRLHMPQALNVLLLYAREQVSEDWLNIGQHIIPALRDDDLGKAVNAARFKGDLGDARIMESAIAYSALTEGERPFGDQAIRALFDDAAQLGRIVATAGVSGLVTLSATQAALAKVIVQFAGDIALGEAGDDIVIGGYGRFIAKGYATLTDLAVTLSNDNAATCRRTA